MAGLTGVEARRALQVIQNLEKTARILRDIPEMQPIARRMLGVIWTAPANGHAAPVKRRKKHWTQTPAGRKKMTEIIRARHGKKR